MTDAAKNATNDAYQGLKNMISRRFGGDAQAETTLAMFESNPDETIAGYLRPHLVDHEITSNPEILLAAENLLELAKNSTEDNISTVQIKGNIEQRADRGGVNQIGGTAGSISTSFTEGRENS
ncbi:hypothetical protein ACH9D3_16645 [Kocuria sp. M4R5S9]